MTEIQLVVTGCAPRNGPFKQCVLLVYVVLNHFTVAVGMDMEKMMAGMGGMPGMGGAGGMEDEGEDSDDDDEMPDLEPSA